MIPVDGLALEDGGHDEGEYNEGDAFLDDLELHQREGTSIDLRTDTVGGNHEGILEEGNAPRHEDDQDEGPVLDLRMNLLQLQIAVPGKRHERIADSKQHDGTNCARNHYWRGYEWFIEKFCSQAWLQTWTMMGWPK